MGDQAIVFFERLQLAPRRRLDELADAVAVLLVDKLEPIVDVRLVGDIRADESSPLGRKGEFAGSDVDVPESVLLSATGNEEAFVALTELGVGLFQLEKLGRDVLVDANPRLDRGRLERLGQDIADTAVENRRDLGARVRVDDCEDLAGGGQSSVAVDPLDQVPGEPIGQPPVDDRQIGDEIDAVDFVKLEVIAGHHRVAPHPEHGIEEGPHVFVVGNDEAFEQRSRPGGWGGPVHRCLIVAPVEIFRRQFSLLS